MALTLSVGGCDADDGSVPSPPPGNTTSAEPDPSAVIGSSGAEGEFGDSSTGRQPLPGPTSADLYMTVLPLTPLWELDRRGQYIKAVSDEMIVNDQVNVPRIVAYTPDATYFYPLGSLMIAQQVFIVGDTVFFGYSRDGGTDYSFVRWTPQSGESSVLWSGDHYIEYAVLGETLFYADLEPGNPCLRAMDVSDPTRPSGDHEVACFSGSPELGWFETDYSTLTFLTRDEDSMCYDAHSVTDQEAVVDHPVDDCLLQATASGEYLAWTEGPPDASLDYYKTEFFISRGTSTQPMGTAETGSPQWCGGQLYWTEAYGNVRLWTWDPATNEAHVAFRAKRDDPVLGGDPHLYHLTCQPGGRLVFFLSGSEGREQYFTNKPLTWKVDL
ncbi:MAG: hypothetical protein ACK5NO_09615 [Demequina sp.]